PRFSRQSLVHEVSRNAGRRTEHKAPGAALYPDAGVVPRIHEDEHLVGAKIGVRIRRVLTLERHLQSVTAGGIVALDPCLSGLPGRQVGLDGPPLDDQPLSRWWVRDVDGCFEIVLNSEVRARKLVWLPAVDVAGEGG